jgi:Asp-tRNA(Asn)/Glu-tRNA(Gln) amidotransferase C subunit
VENALRSDVPEATLERQTALAVGRADSDGRFIVPRTVDEGN